jgi:cytochrome d ubiquinol oxidase subunit II
LALVFLAFTGFVISLWPNYHSTISHHLASGSTSYPSQMFALVGALILIPIIIAYTIVSYWVFRDKVRVGDEGYH